MIFATSQAIYLLIRLRFAILIFFIISAKQLPDTFFIGRAATPPEYMARAGAHAMRAKQRSLAAARLFV